jgi:hypothetical protein
VIGAPPLLDGGVKLTEACMLPATAVTPVGGPGTLASDGEPTTMLPNRSPARQMLVA